MTIAKIFRNGGSQAVRIPAAFALPGEEVIVRRLGRALLLVPKEDAWDVFEESLRSFSDDFMNDREQPTEQQEREEL